MKIPIVSIAIFICVTSFGQQLINKLKFPLEYGDGYVLKIRPDTLLFSSKGYCIFKETHNLHQIKILQILHGQFGGLHVDSIAFKRLKYAVFSHKLSDSLISGKEYYITAQTTPSSLFLSARRIISLSDNENYKFISPIQNIIGFSGCGKKDKTVELFNNFISERNRAGLGIHVVKETTHYEKRIAQLLLNDTIRFSGNRIGRTSFGGCNRKFTEEILHLKLIGVKRFSAAALLTVVNFKNLPDTFKLISFKANIYGSEGAINNHIRRSRQKMKQGQTYLFKIKPPSLLAVHTCFRYYFIRAGKDIIWRSNNEDNVPYYSLNSRGQYITNPLP